MGQHSKQRVPSVKERKYLMGALRLLGIVVALIAIAIAFAFYMDTLTPTVAKGQATKANPVTKTTAEASETAEPPPVMEDGAPNWVAVEQYLETAPPAEAEDFLDTLQEIHQGELTLGMIHAYAAKEQKGKDYHYVVPAGTWVVNTTRPDAKGNIKILWRYQLPKDRVVLVDEKGEVRVLTSCGNIAKVISLPAGQKLRPVPPRPSARKPDRNEFSWTTPHHPGNPSTQPPQANTGNTDVRTPGVTLGEPERVKDTQDANAGNPNPVPGGKTGEGTGGDTAPDGTITTNPEPTTQPDTTDTSTNSGDPGMPN